MGSLKPLVVAAAALQASKLPRNQTTGNRWNTAEAPRQPQEYWIPDGMGFLFPGPGLCSVSRSVVSRYIAPLVCSF